MRARFRRSPRPRGGGRIAILPRLPRCPGRITFPPHDDARRRRRFRAAAAISRRCSARCGPGPPAQVVLVLSNRADAGGLERARGARRAAEVLRQPGRRRGMAGPAGAASAWTSLVLAGLPQAGARRRGRAVSRPHHQHPSRPAAGVRRQGDVWPAGARGGAGERGARDRRHRPPGRRGVRPRRRSWPRRGCRCCPDDTPTASPPGCSRPSTGCCPAAVLAAAAAGRPVPSHRTVESHLVSRSLMPRALISVSDKRGIVAFAQGLVGLGWEIISTGGTAATLRAAGVPVTLVDAGHRLPRDARRPGEDPASRRCTAPCWPGATGPSTWPRSRERGIAPIDLVAVNLYPFQMTIARPGVSLRGRDREHRHRRPLDAALRREEPRVRAAGRRSRPTTPSVLEMLRDG